MYNDLPHAKSKAEEKLKPGIYIGNAFRQRSHDSYRKLKSRIGKFSEYTPNASKRHETFYTSERKLLAVSDDETKEIIPSGTRSWPQRSRNLTDYTFLLNAIAAADRKKCT